ncbi:MAG: DEAD/DEAH box helicase [Chthoniobacteraceae bacterium]
MTTEEIEAADAWLASLNPHTEERAQVLARGGRVGDLESFKRGIGLRAQVAGGALYASKVRYDEGEWWGECSCPVSINCKHCAAVMITALDQLRDDAAPGAAAEATSFEACMAARLKRELSLDEQRTARVVDRLFREHRDSKVVPKSRVDAISNEGVEPPRSRETVELWPQPPRSAWEAWLCLASYFRRNSLRLPDGWASATGWSEVDALVGDWERGRTIERWNKWLDQADSSSSFRDAGCELRVRLARDGIVLDSRSDETAAFKPMPRNVYERLLSESNAGRQPCDTASLPLWRAFDTGYGALPTRGYDEPDGVRILNRLLRDPAAAGRVVGLWATPLAFSAEPLTWRIETPEKNARVDYRFALVCADGSAAPSPIVVLDGEPSLYVTFETIYPGPPLGGLDVNEPIEIPAEALETPGGVALLDRLAIEPPTRLAGRVQTVRLRPVFKCVLEENPVSGERLIVELLAESAPGVHEEAWHRDGWQPLRAAAPFGADAIVRRDRSALTGIPEQLETLKLQWWPHEKHWHKQMNRKLPEQFATWLAAMPSHVSFALDPVLASLREPAIAARVKLEVGESSMDWFDLRVALDVADTTLTKKELKALLDARGGLVRLGAKGWRRIAFQLSEEDEAELAELGLSTHEFSGQPQRLHALQLAGKRSAKKLLGEEHSRAIQRRAEEIRTRVMPDVPASISAELRPYQVEGFHFLAYLTANRFGGILADDMGLGKTLQTLTWIEWLRVQPDSERQPSLVVCPKSVMDNWLVEARRFVPGLRVQILPIGATPADVDAARGSADIVVVNYAQLRALEEPLSTAPWLAAILDEAQAIKNPESQTAKIAWKLKTSHRLALSGTPIENRLLDLWSIMHFAMPGALGPRAQFSKTFDQRADPLARRRLSARVRPFIIRRTKGEVAKELPERIEEDLHCEFDGTQATLYRAELKRARAALLKLTSQADLDAARFNILTSLLRLRQICCHPALISTKAAPGDSAKLNALLDLLEPLMAEGHKVLVFSQFVEMLSLIRAEVVAREWRHFVLTGDTENRGALVADFQSSEGGAVFLISLRAGGFGLNLTAASYVVLFDPWWNPAVENQAIDRTHRIGQRNTVIAYRLLVKDTIEEKIRALQTQKRALAADILGEENFARTLSLEDFRYLLGEE